MNTLSRRLFTASCLALLAPAARSQGLWEEGRHYLPVGPLDPPDVPAGKIPVTEVFSYACPHCYHALDEVENLKARFAADTVMSYVHAGFNPRAGWPLFQRAFCTAQVLGIAVPNHRRLFSAIWETMEFPYIDRETGTMRQSLPTIADAARFYAMSGAVTVEAFIAAAGSPQVNAAVDRAETLVAGWKVPSTPSFVVGGRYIINSAALESWTQLYQVVDYLVGKERARLRGPATAGALP